MTTIIVHRFDVMFRIAGALFMKGFRHLVIAASALRSLLDHPGFYGRLLP